MRKHHRPHQASAPEPAAGGRPPVPVTPGNAALARALAEAPARVSPALVHRLSQHSSNAQLARFKSDQEVDVRESTRAIGVRADELIELHRGHPDELAAAILGDLGRDGLLIAQAVFDRSGGELAALLGAIAGAHDEAALGSATPEVSQFLLTVARRLREVGNVAEAERLVSVLVSPSHAHMLGESAGSSAEVQGALEPHGATLQSVKDGVGPVVYDEYWIVLDSMPSNLTPEQYLSEMSTDINRAVADETFDKINTFSRTQPDQQRGAPAVGDVVDIDFTGPDNGSVMLVEATPEHFIYQTATTPQLGKHPEYGSREFGFERPEDGSVRFYTRGVSRPVNALVGMVGASIQERDWTAMLNGIGNALQARGGTLRPGSFGHWIRRG
jgi:hypothetical protein